MEKSLKFWMEHLSSLLKGNERAFDKLWPSILNYLPDCTADLVLRGRTWVFYCSAITVYSLIHATYLRSEITLKCPCNALCDDATGMSVYLSVLFFHPVLSDLLIPVLAVICVLFCFCMIKYCGKKKKERKHLFYVSFCRCFPNFCFFGEKLNTLEAAKII